FSEMNQPCVPQKLPLQAARFPQSRYLHGIDFKNPFTMSKRMPLGIPNRCSRSGSAVFIKLDVRSATHAVSRSKAAPYGAL
ncbi:hypothetical protein, partial [Sphingomonas carotinifaciens]|uniref:hypothetical protein n=1 Tax=Sphingomonas carotinifaciens TaxID=1166323 RepID=UPI001967F2F3